MVNDLRRADWVLILGPSNCQDIMQNSVQMKPIHAQESPNSKDFPAMPMYVFVLAEVEKNAKAITQPGISLFAM